MSAPASKRGLAAALGRALQEALTRELATDAVVVAGSPAQRVALWLLREGISEAQKTAGAGLKNDVTLPIGQLADSVAPVEPRLGRVVPRVRLVTYGHVHSTLTA